jgi:glycosyltransferase involved in cell wall biosynthesis
LRTKHDMKDVILDITEFLSNPIRTGIQRVVRELVRHWSAPDNLTLARFGGEELLPISRLVVPLLVGSIADAEPERLRRLIATMLDEPAPPLPDKAPILVPEVFYDRERCAWYRELLRHDPNAASFIIYDFIPWLYPHLVGVTSTTPLMPYLQLIRAASRAAFISGQTRVTYWERIKRDDPNCGLVLSLGANGLSLERQFFRPDKRSWVSIGSIDGRKKQESIVRAFRELWNNGFDGELVLIGRVYEHAECAWLNVALQDARLRHLAGVADEAVRAELRRARATIYVSDVEGFGLPPVESLYAGIPVIVTSNVPSISDLPPAGQIRLASAEVHEIAAAVEATADDATAERLWDEAATLQLSTWRDFAVRTATWMEGQR